MIVLKSSGDILRVYFFLKARAKVELREVATELDALEVVEIMKQTINDVPNDKVSLFNASITSKSGKPTKNKVKYFYVVIIKSGYIWMTGKNFFKSVINCKSLRFNLPHRMFNSLSFFIIIDI